MKKIYLLTTLCLCMFTARLSACDCGPAHSEKILDEKVYGGENYVFFTAEVVSVEAAFHLEVTVLLKQVYLGSKFIKDQTKPVTVFFDLRTACAIQEQINIKAGNVLFITSVYNTMGRMLITNNCDAFFPADQLATYQLLDYLESLKGLE